MVALLGSPCSLPQARAANDDAVPLEYKVKAAFLQRFLKFIDWPADSQPAVGDTIVVGIVDCLPMYDALRALADRPVLGRRLEIRMIHDSEPWPDGCHVVFVPREIDSQPRSKNSRWRHLEDLRKRPILTVGEDDEFIIDGGTIGFFKQGDHIRFAISKSAIESTGLAFGSDLLRLARLVD